MCIPKPGDKVIVINNDNYSGKKIGEKGIVEFVSLYYWRATVQFEGGIKTSVHLNNINIKK
jgi:hypothetical protein